MKTIFCILFSLLWFATSLFVYLVTARYVPVVGHALAMWLSFLFGWFWSGALRRALIRAGLS